MQGNAMTMTFDKDASMALGEFLNRRSGMTLVLRGYTEQCREFCDQLDGVRPVAIVDRNPLYHGSAYRNIPIIPPDGMIDCERIVAILFVKQPEPVRLEMMDAGVPSDQIFSYRELRRKVVESINAGLPKLSVRENEDRLDAERCRAALCTCRPRYVSLETSADCNFNCVMCAYHDEDLKKRVNAGIDYDISPDSIDYILSSAEIVAPFGAGEPLLKPAFWRCLDYIRLHYPEKKVQIVTNGSLLNDANIARLVDSPIKHIEISVDGATAKTYERLRNFSFDRVVTGIAGLVEAKNRKQRDNLNISIAFVMMRETIEELPDMVLLAKKLGVNDLRIVPLMPREHAETWRVESRSKKSGDDFCFFYYQQMLDFYPKLVRSSLNKAKDLAARTGMPLIENAPVAIVPGNDLPYPMPPDAFMAAASRFKRQLSAGASVDGGDGGSAVPDACATPGGDDSGICKTPWEHYAISAIGEVTICCHLPRNLLPNIHERPFEEIWNNPIVQNVRHGIIQGRLNAVCHSSECVFARQESLAGSQPSPLPFGQPVHFSAQMNNARKFLDYDGLGRPELEGAWFVKNTASITYFVVPAQKRTHRLHLHWLPYGGGGDNSEGQEVTATIGSFRSVASFAARGFQDWHIDIPGTCISSEGGVTVAFDFPRSFSMRTLNPNDSRRVSFQLGRLRISDAAINGE
jgi:MoaA/NifB/PqqE/SkfB family radical SAM enzyme